VKSLVLCVVMLAGTALGQQSTGTAKIDQPICHTVPAGDGCNTCRECWSESFGTEVESCTLAYCIHKEPKPSWASTADSATVVTIDTKPDRRCYTSVQGLLAQSGPPNHRGSEEPCTVMWEGCLGCDEKHEWLSDANKPSAEEAIKNKALSDSCLASGGFCIIQPDYAPSAIIEVRLQNGRVVRFDICLKHGEIRVLSDTKAPK
jgi:hypothetical protein